MMSARPEYWFARRFPVGDRRNAFAPVHWKGFVAAGVFVLTLLIGGFAFAWMGASGDLMWGSVVFAVTAFVSAGWFITVANAKGDKTRTVADYKKANSRV
ncbi:MAG TPA: hypothetical protein VEA80_00060 [Vitreimonas sp.]|uniref:hypothetical protein n=1 Tax=Vitreimonas sp. TaxID=3069702 RepID=UPI002D47C1AE|nr:hypothetical protein [Vitreimonas sp.]HYD85846.1 hypothetical protein [Vitreimonas sp.]